MKKSVFVVAFSLVLAVRVSAAEERAELKLRIFWGHDAATAAAYSVKVVPTEVEIVDAKPLGLEPPDRLKDGLWETQAGGGDIDGLELRLHYKEILVQPIKGLHPIWRDLIAQSDPDTARRLTLDPAYRPDSRRLTLELGPEPARGFTVTIDQLLQARRFWIPALGVYLDAGSEPVPFDEHRKRLEPLRGQRVLDQVDREPEATYGQLKGLWEDMGSPSYRHPAQPAPGHIVCLTWDSAIRKFGVDRGAGVWNDYGNPDRFRLWFDFGDLAGPIAPSWRGQRLTDGFPVIVTQFEKAGVRYEVEQLAYPLHGPPAERRGDIDMVLIEKVKLTEQIGRPQAVRLAMHHQRKLPPVSKLELVQAEGAVFLVNPARDDVLLSLEGVEKPPVLSAVQDLQGGVKQAEINLAVDVPAHGVREFVVKLPSPMLRGNNQLALAGLDYTAARADTLRFWADYEARGAQFRVPEEPVNELFRANLWHALRLPRRHGGQQAAVQIDLPYSNFAYDQNGSPWPVNQAIYVDYMIYDLRGFHSLAAEELGVIFGNNQEPSGHVKGYANWLVYTPSMLYAVAKNYLLSQDRETFEALLPASLKAMDWCLAELQKAKQQPGVTQGLVRGPLNDGTGEGYWAFNQAYMFAGLDLFGRALKRAGHPRADECLAAAQELRQAVERAFRRASVLSPLVQLRDRTWIPYVPCEVNRPGRRLDQWYPTDVDTGAVHLLRLRALPADGRLAECLLHDHEDNLFLHGWGMANEPVYNPQATAYLLRDQPKAAIRAFYSMMACALSHSVFEPVEHRWTHGQYFGPPSTDGAWAELYRNMLIRELDDGGLLLFAATPRNWLEDGKWIEIWGAPTYYGQLSARVESHAQAGKLIADVQVPGYEQPQALIVRFRHPQGRAMRSVRVNGQAWSGFDVQKEWVRIDHPTARRYTVEVEY
jgi:hypothetical protein